MKKDFISLVDFTKEQIEGFLELTFDVKKNPQKYSDFLKQKSFALLFEKPSTRTRVSFQVGITQLGGQGFYLAPADVGLGVREDIRDVARTLSRYLDGIILRTFKHDTIIEFSKYANIPVINGLSDLLHPCQGLSDIVTMKEKMDDLSKAKIVYIGDGNNVVHSLIYAVVMLGANITVATPSGYEPDKAVMEKARQLCAVSGGSVELSNNPAEAAKDADFLYTDVWTSMGQEAERAKRIKDFSGFQINTELLNKAKKACYVMHCLPAHRSEEITGEVMEGPNQIVFDQAENRMHAQKAILLSLFNK